MSNRSTFEAVHVVDDYIRETALQAPELAIQKQLQPNLAQMTMLDIGVGAGRTTLHFARQVKRYVGVDYAAEMIAACQTRFTDYPASVTFAVGDATDLQAFAASTFDFVLFSFNGIDYVSPPDRLKVYAEVKRVGTSDGYFCLSTHNLQSATQLFSLRSQISNRPKQSIKKLLNWWKLRVVHNRAVNFRSLKRQPYAILNDGAHDFSLSTYYVTPAEQVRQLALYFADIHVLGLNGLTIPAAAFSTATNVWLYYLCRIRAK